jgi:hypothetical protein
MSVCYYYLYLIHQLPHWLFAYLCCCTTVGQDLPIPLLGLATSNTKQRPRHSGSLLNEMLNCVKRERTAIANTPVKRYIGDLLCNILATCIKQDLAVRSGRKIWPYKPLPWFHRWHQRVTCHLRWLSAFRAALQALCIVVC